jgi:hypothetical protein
VKVWVEMPDTDSATLRRSLDEEFARSGGSTQQGWETLQFRPGKLFQEGLEAILENALRKHPGSRRSLARRRRPYTRKQLKRRRKAIHAARRLAKGCFSRGTLLNPPWKSLN